MKVSSQKNWGISAGIHKIEKLLVHWRGVREGGIDAVRESRM